MKTDNAHEFALFIGGSKYSVDQHAQKLIIQDTDLINRIVPVLRLKVGKTIILFDNTFSYNCMLAEITKKSVICTISSSNAVSITTPEINLLLPVLEREALEDSVYMATVYGVSSIQLVATEKSRRSLAEKDYLRLEKIAISAAEQSKQFCIPKINPIITLEVFLQKHISAYKQAIKLWCDISGKNILQELAQEKSEKNYLVTLGPEGDYTTQEKELLTKDFTPIKLTNTILRSRDAASLLLGIVRVKATIPKKV
jgi:16S rRNA (uracil1498-N3)-methyltransferase